MFAVTCARASIFQPPQERSESAPVSSSPSKGRSQEWSSTRRPCAVHSAMSPAVRVLVANLSREGCNASKSGSFAYSARSALSCLSAGKVGEGGNEQQRGRTRHTGSLADGTDDADDLQDPTLLFFICAHHCFRILPDDRIRDWRELLRTFTVVDEGGEDTTKKGKGFFDLIAYDIMLDKGYC